MCLVQFSSKPPRRGAQRVGATPVPTPSHLRYLCKVPSAHPRAREEVFANRLKSRIPAAQSLTKHRGPKCRLTQRFNVPSMTGLLFRHFPFNAISISTGYRAPTVALVRCLPRSCWGGAARAVTVLSMSPPPNSGWHGYCTKIIRVCCPVPGTMRKQTERFHRFLFKSPPTCAHTRHTHTHTVFQFLPSAVLRTAN